MLVVCLLTGLTTVGAKSLRLLANVDSAAMRRTAERSVTTTTEAPRSTAPQQPRAIPAQRPVATPEQPKRDSAQRPERTKSDTTKRRSTGMQLTDIIQGKATDSVVFDARNKMIYSYREGDVTYQGMTLKADFMRVKIGRAHV